MRQCWQCAMALGREYGCCCGRAGAIHELRWAAQEPMQVSTYTGTLLGDFGGIRRVCAFMLNDPDVMTHQLPAASRACEAALIAQLPWLAELNPPRDDLTALRVWLDDLLLTRGLALDLEPIPAPDWIPGNGLNDLLDLAAHRAGRLSHARRTIATGLSDMTVATKAATRSIDGLVFEFAVADYRSERTARLSRMRAQYRRKQRGWR